MDIDIMTQGYAEAGLWTASCNGMAEHDACHGEDCDVSLFDIGYGPDDLPTTVMANLRQECADFVELCETQRPAVFDDLDPAQVGHDFWLTANRHGAGFWDRGLGERGDFLTEWAHSYSPAHFYVGANGVVDYS